MLRPNLLFFFFLILLIIFPHNNNDFYVTSQISVANLTISCIKTVLCESDQDKDMESCQQHHTSLTQQATTHPGSYIFL